MKHFSISVIYLVFVLSSSLTYSQSRYIYTKSFTEKLNKFGLDFFKPAENWLHPIPYEADHSAEYDMVFVSEDDSLEVRYIFQDVSNPLALSNTPHIEFIRMISTLATNQEEEDIVVNTISEEDLYYKYQAYWGLTSEFIPKRSVAKRKKAKALVIFHPYRGLIFSLLFYNNDRAPAFFELPIRFKRESDYE